jgi:hypothetical protein
MGSEDEDNGDDDEDGDDGVTESSIGSMRS